MGSGFLRGIRDNINKSLKTKKVPKSTCFYLKEWKYILVRYKEMMNNINNFVRVLTILDAKEINCNRQIRVLKAKYGANSSSKSSSSSSSSGSSSNDKSNAKGILRSSHRRTMGATIANNNSPFILSSEELLEYKGETMPHFTKVMIEIFRSCSHKSKELHMTYRKFLDPTGPVSILKKKIEIDSKKFEVQFKTNVKIWENYQSEFLSAQSKLNEINESKKSTEDARTIAKINYDRTLESLKNATSTHEAKMKELMDQVEESHRELENKFREIIKSYGAALIEASKKDSVYINKLYPGFDQIITEKDYLKEFIRKYGPSEPFVPKCLEDVSFQGEMNLADDFKSSKPKATPQPKIQLNEVKKEKELSMFKNMSVNPLKDDREEFLANEAFDEYGVPKVVDNRDETLAINIDNTIQTKKVDVNKNQDNAHMMAQSYVGKASLDQDVFNESNVNLNKADDVNNKDNKLLNVEKPMIKKNQDEKQSNDFGGSEYDIESDQIALDDIKDLNDGEIDLSSVGIL